jgi:general stress protein CsbA
MVVLHVWLYVVLCTTNTISQKVCAIITVVLITLSSGETFKEGFKGNSSTKI